MSSHEWSPRKIVRRARWALAAAILVVTVGLIAAARLTSGFEHTGVHQMIMGVWSMGAIVIPILLGIDLFGHAAWATASLKARDYRGAGGLILRTVVSDALLFVLTLACGLAVLTLSG